MTYKIYYDTFFLFLLLIITTRLRLYPDLWWNTYSHKNIIRSFVLVSPISFFLSFRQFAIFTVSYSQPFFVMSRIIQLFQHPIIKVIQQTHLWLIRNPQNMQRSLNNNIEFWSFHFMIFWKTCQRYYVGILPGWDEAKTKHLQFLDDLSRSWNFFGLGRRSCGRRGNSRLVVY